MISKGRGLSCICQAACCLPSVVEGSDRSLHPSFAMTPHTAAHCVTGWNLATWHVTSINGSDSRSLELPMTTDKLAFPAP
jgi:hypothetical protein